jgi:hypothetical protein
MADTCLEKLEGGHVRVPIVLQQTLSVWCELNDYEGWGKRKATERVVVVGIVARLGVSHGHGSFKLNFFCVAREGGGVGKKEMVAVWRRRKWWQWLGLGWRGFGLGLE